VRLILDTHVFLWWRDDDPRLKGTVRDAVASADLVVFSAVSAWEIAIKVEIGKLRVTASLDQVFDPPGFSKLSLSASHALTLSTLPHHHRDPFDRMLIAQALVDGLTVVTHDRRFEPYPVQVLWT
jgi:PIN domain nuclease of toxin-antitoxin system